MGLIAHGGILYGGGSDVVANPQDSATDTLSKVGIDGTVYTVEDADAIHTSDVGTANGVAELDANGLVPSSQLPSYVDDVLEYASVSAFPATGETGKIYVALDTNLTYRWSGSTYVEISPSLALGETSSTAYRGDRGKTAYEHATESGKISAAVTSGLYKFGATAQGHIASTTPVAKSDLTALGVADQNDVDAIEEDIQGYKTVTGEYITVSDGAELPAKAFSVTLTPFQEGSGTPSPSNIRPIHGTDEVGVNVEGKNQFNADAFVSAYPTRYEFDGDSIKTKSSLNTGDVLWENTSGISGQIAYTFIYKYANTGSVGIRPKILYTDGTSGSVYPDNYQTYHTYTGTTQAGKTVDKIVTDYGSGLNTTNFYLQIEFGTTHTAYEPYNGHSTTVTLPTTVYGGTVDVTGGSGEKTYQYIEFDGSNDEAWDIYQADGINQLYIPTADLKGYTLNLYANEFKTISINDRTGNYGTIYASSTAICVNIENIASVADFRTWLASNNLQVAYELATAVSLSTTPTSISLLNGVNNVWSECSENNVVVGNAQQSLTYQPQNIVGQLRQEINGKIDKGWHDSFSNLTDTAFSNLANGQIPKWNSTTSKWENANESGGGGLPAWTVLAGLGYNDDVELPATFSELLVVVANGDGYNDLLSSSIFIADVADFDVSAERFPVLQIPIYIQGSTMWSILEGSVSNNKRIYTLKGYQNSIAVIYYR